MKGKEFSQLKFQIEPIKFKQKNMQLNSGLFFFVGSTQNTDQHSTSPVQKEKNIICSQNNNIKLSNSQDQDILQTNPLTKPQVPVPMSQTISTFQAKQANMYPQFRLPEILKRPGQEKNKIISPPRQTNTIYINAPLSTPSGSIYEKQYSVPANVNYLQETIQDQHQKQNQIESQKIVQSSQRFQKTFYSQEKKKENKYKDEPKISFDRINSNLKLIKRDHSNLQNSSNNREKVQTPVIFDEIAESTSSNEMEQSNQFFKKKMKYFDEQKAKLQALIQRQTTNLEETEKKKQTIVIKPQQKRQEDKNKMGRFKIQQIERREIDDYVVGELLGSEFKIKILGRGSYASVRIVTNKDTGEKFAVKIYEKSRLFDPFRQKNVLKEIELLKQFDHTNIIKLIKVVETQKHMNLIMELGGDSLKTYLKSSPNRKLDEVELIYALRYLHSKRIVHRDIKLDNILIDKEKNIRIIDFGFATQVPQPPSFLSQSCGTPPYMSPELIPPFARYNELTDIWSIGVVLYLMITGRFPFSASNEKELYTKIRKGLYQEGGSGNLWTFIEYCLEKDFTQRQSAHSILLNLQSQGFTQ